MSVNLFKKKRNIGIIAHIDAGKTTTTERILLYTGTITKMGEVHDGQATMDWMVQERERGITITSAATSCAWYLEGEKYDFDLIDTPGHVDFTIEVERSLRVLDGAVCVFDGVEGAQTQTVTVWRQADKYKVPRIIFINKMDRMGANFEHSVDTIETRLHSLPLVIFLPIGVDQSFSGTIDLIKMKSLSYEGKNGMEVKEHEIPSEYMEKAVQFRNKMLETIATEDEHLLEKFLETGDLSENEIHYLIRIGTLRNSFIPTLCGSSYKNVGVQTVLDAVCRYLPCPQDRGLIYGLSLDKETLSREQKPTEKFCGLVFKLMNDPYAGNLSFVRVYSGQLKCGDRVLVPRTNKYARIGRIVKMHAQNREEVKEINTGEIAAIIGDIGCASGDTICDEDYPIILEDIGCPERVITQSVTPKTRNDQEKLSKALNRLTHEDPSFGYGTDPDSGQTIISGMGELHLEIIKDRLKREFNVDVEVGKPRVAYRETFAKSGEIDYLHKKQSGGAGQFARICMEICPLERDSGIKFIDQIVGGVIKKEYMPSIEKGIKEIAKAGGLLTNSPVVDFSIRVFDGEMHDVDSSSMAFEIAARSAFRQLLKDTGSKLLEPIMNVEVEGPSSFLGNIIGDLNARRGKIGDIIDERNDYKKVFAEVPLGEMFGYINKLRETTQGTATYTMSLRGYEFVPDSIVSKIREDLGFTILN